LKSVKIPKSVKQIDEEAFTGYTGLEEIIFEEGSQLETIGEEAFSNCESLKKIAIPKSVKRIDEYAFTGFFVFIDKKSAVYLTGLEVDYVKNGLNEGFEFRNPNEKDRCGCGESFRV
jgi:hypothetical protein